MAFARQRSDEIDGLESQTRLPEGLDREAPPAEAAALARRRRRAGQNQLAAVIRRFARHRLALLGLLIFILLALMALFPGWFSPANPIRVVLSDALEPPSLAHPLGTDSFGRDVLARVVHGSRVSLFVGLASVLASILIGIPIGLIGGFRGGRLDNILMRFMDAILSFPPLLLAVAIMGSLGADIRNVILALGLVYTPLFARLVRSTVLSAKEEDYVLAVRAVGARDRRIIFFHILPNVLAPLVVQATATFSFAIIAEASLSFLGLGVQPPTPSWGQDINEGRRYIQEAWWTVVGPALMISLAVLGIDFLGDGLRDALDPHMRTAQ